MTSRPKDPTPESFARDVAEHVLTIEHDQGLHRRLICAKPGSWDQRFELVTWPGELCYTGDMGTYVFARLSDMFEFFRRPGGGINPAYWSEKLTAVCRTGGVLRFCEHSFRQRVVAEFRSHWRGVIERDGSSRDVYERRRGCWEQLREDVLWNVEDESLPRQALDDFDCEGLRFYDTWEWDFNEYTAPFIWSLRAIVWAIQQYDAAKAQQVAA